MHFPPLFWVGKAYNWRCFSHCPLCSAILGKISTSRLWKNDITADLLWWQAEGRPKADFGNSSAETVFC